MISTDKVHARMHACMHTGSPMLQHKCDLALLSGIGKMDGFQGYWIERACCCGFMAVAY